jgi:hypothetical protein
MARRHRAIRFKSSLVPRCGLSATIPCPKEQFYKRGVHPINMSIDNTKIFFDILTIIQINLTPIIVIDFKR